MISKIYCQVKKKTSNITYSVIPIVFTTTLRLDIICMQFIKKYPEEYTVNANSGCSLGEEWVAGQETKGDP